MADYSISTEVTLDESKFSSGVKKAQTSSKKLSSVISGVTKGFGKGGLLGAVTSTGLALGGIGLAVGVAVKTFQKLSKTIGECTEAYKKQLNAERALDTAIKNSPIMTESASKNLKEFASQIQKTSNIGDEELLPMMAQLVATGRNEAEVMKIIQTATDMSATGTISLDTAITQLNATLNGNIGRLGQQNAELKGLTEEELKNGKAVDILASKYKGMAENTIDTSKQLKNAIGDLKEAYGSTFENALAPVRKYFTTIIQGWADAKKARDEYDNAEKAKESGTATSSQLVIYYEQQLKYIADEKKMYEGMYGADLEFAQSKLKTLELEENKYKSLIATEKNRQKVQEKLKQTEAERQAELEKQKEAEQEIIDLKDKYLKKLAEQESKWANIKTVTGEEVDLAEKIKFYEDELVNIMTEAGGKITENNQYYKDQLAIIERLRSGLEPEEKETSDTWVEKIRQQAIARLEAEKEAYEESVDLEKTTALERYLVRKDLNEKIYALQREQLIAERQQALKSVEGTKNEYEEKARIVEYYNKELEDLSKKFTNQMEAEGKQGGKSFSKGFSIALEGIKKTMKGIMIAIKGIKGVADIFKKLFKIDTSSALDSLLAFEDMVLTFFVETLPKLPQFVASVIQSIQVLLANIFEGGGLDTFAKVFEQVLDIAMEGIEWLFSKLTANIPKIIKMIVSMVTKVIKKLPQLLKVIIPAIATLITDIIKQLPTLITTMLPVLLDSVKLLVMELIKALPQIMGALAEALPEIIIGVVNAISEFIKNLTVDDLASIITSIIKAIGTLVWGLIKSIPKILEALLDLFVEVVKHMGDVFVKALKKAWSGASWLLDTIVDFVKKIFGYANGTDDAKRGLALVGEQGPELVRFNGGEQVLNTKNTQKALANVGGGGSVFNVTFENTVDTTAFAMMKQLKNYQRTLAFNGVL